MSSTNTLTKRVKFEVGPPTVTDNPTSTTTDPTTLTSSAAHPLLTACKILSYEDLPPWLQTDAYIHRGYRPEQGSLQSCLHSLFTIHNELVNTWIHLLPGLVYVAALAGFPLPGFHALDTTSAEVGGAENVDGKVVMQLYMAGAAALLLFSATYHMLIPHQHYGHKCLKLDYSGITIGILGTNVSSTYSGLREHGALRGVYNGFTVACGIAILASLLSPAADGVKAAYFRVAAFAALMLSGCVPIAHMYLTEGIGGVAGFPLKALVVMECWYGAGTVFYVSHWPEKYFPKKFDIWGASHQIFHGLVVVGQYVYLMGLRETLGRSNV